MTKNSMTNQTHSQRLIPYKWELLVLLWIAFCFNQADRQIYNNLLPQIQPELELSDEQAGLVATVFTAIYGILVPISGYAGDAFRRKWVIIGALALWSAATLMTGLAGGIIGLIVFRGLATGKILRSPRKTPTRRGGRRCAKYSAISKTSRP
jgi:MFS family permease